MQNKDNTGLLEYPVLDCEAWAIAFTPYANEADRALILAYNLTELLSCLQSDFRNIPEVIASLDRAINVLYRHTDFHRVSRELYRVAIAGKLEPKREKMLRRLGVRI